MLVNEDTFRFKFTYGAGARGQGGGKWRQGRDVFPEGHFARIKQKLFVSFPPKEAVASDYFLLSGIEGGMTQISVSDGRLFRSEENGRHRGDRHE